MLTRKSVAGALLGAALLTGCGSSGASIFPAPHKDAPVGYNDPTTLAASFQTELQDKLDRGSSGLVIDTVFCFHDSGTHFICHTKTTDGTETNTNVTVSSDGTHWAS